MTALPIIDVENISEEKVRVKVDSQILNSIDLCDYRYFVEHVMNMRPATKAPALEKGSVMHTMLAHYYRQKMKGRIPSEHHAVVEEAIILGRVEASGYQFELTEFEEECAPTFKEYILAKQNDGWNVLAVEEPFTKLLYEDNELQILYEGIVDLRAEQPNLGRITVDHKSESRKSHPFELSNQFIGYKWAFGDQVVINKVGFQTSLADQERFRRYYLPILDHQIEEWKVDTVKSIKEAIEWHRTGIFARNRTSCDKYSGCVYKKVCVAPPEAREFKIQAYFVKDKPWDPYTRDNE